MWESRDRCWRVEHNIPFTKEPAPLLPQVLTRQIGGEPIAMTHDAAGFEVLPKRWIVERTFAWISRNRRLARDFERYATTVAAFVRIAMIRIKLRRLAVNASS